jgi:hypothetical protein
MTSLTDDLESILATTVEMLVADGSMDAAALLRSADPQIEETGYDNWNGGTTIWTLYLRIQAREFARLGSRKEGLESQIDNRLKPIVEQFSGDWVGVKIAPKLEEKRDWRQQAH